MKKIIIILMPILFTACFTQKLSKSGNAEINYVKGFIQHMIADTNSKSETLKKFISPKYLKSNNLNIDKYNINTYYPVDFKVENYSRETGIVTVKIWGKDKGWIHKLDFKLEKEKGNLYLIPGKYTEGYIHPWFSVEAYVKE